MIPDYILDRTDPGTPVVYCHSLRDPDSGNPVNVFFSGIFTSARRAPHSSASVRSTDSRVAGDWVSLRSDSAFLFPLDSGDLRRASVPQGLRARLFFGLSEDDQNRVCFRRAIGQLVDQFPEILERTKEYAESHEVFPRPSAE